MALEGFFKHDIKSHFFFLFSVPQPVVLFPLNAKYQTRDIKNRTAPGIPSGVSLAPGPNGEEDGSYEFFGNANSFIEFPNSPGGALDVRYSMTILCWVYYDENGGPDGPIFNYNTGGRYGVHFWVLNKLFYARFNDRAFLSLPFLHHTSLAGGWKFVGASYDNETGEIKLWADGAFKQTNNMKAGVDLGTQGSVRMGVRKNGKRYFKGKISQLQIYNEALSQQQILKLATKPKGEKTFCAGTISRYNQGSVAQSMVGTKRWFGSIKTYTFLLYSTLFSNNEASRHSGQGPVSLKVRKTFQARKTIRKTPTRLFNQGWSFDVL